MTISLEKYETFASTGDLNEAIRIHLRNTRYNLNTTAISVLEAVSRHAVKYPGAAWLKIDTLAGIVGKSAPTVRRALALLEKLAIIKRVPIMRPKRGGNGGNVLQILAPAKPDDCPQMIARRSAENADAPTVEGANLPKESTILKSQDPLFNNTYSAEIVKRIKSPYISFKETARMFVGNNEDKLINRMYGVFLAQTKYLKTLHREAELLAIGQEALKVTMQATKRKQIGNLVGFYNGTLDRMFDRLHLATTYPQK